MRALILTVILAGSGTGTHHQPGGAADPRVVGPFTMNGGVLAGTDMVRWVAPRAGALTAMHWVETAAGVGTSMTYAVRVNGDTACSLTVACDSTGRVSQDCTAEVPAGSEVSVLVLTDNCAVSNPAGTLMLVLQ